MNHLQSQIFISQCLTPFQRTENNNILHRKIQSKAIAWEQVIYLASTHLVVPALYASLKRKNLLYLLPDDVQEYLIAMFTLSSQRNKKILNQLNTLLVCFDKKNIHPILLKGASSIRTGLYEDAAERVMCDIDILLPEEEMHLAVKQMFSIGYDYCQVDHLPDPPADEHEDPISALNKRGLGYMHHIHPLCQPQTVASVELHRHISLRTSKELLLTSQLCFDESVISSESDFRILSLEHRLIHNFYNTQIQDRNAYLGKVDMTQLYEFVQIIYRYQKIIQWKVIRNRINHCGLNHHFKTYLQHAEYYFNVPIPGIFESSAMARFFVTRHRLLASNQFLRAIDGFIMLILLKVAREFSPIRVKYKYKTTPIVIGYFKNIIGNVSKLFQPAWLKETWKQFLDNLHS